MPYKDPEQKKAYQREYMRQRRADVRPSTNPEPEPVRFGEKKSGPPQFIDRDRPYHEEDGFPYPACLVQDGFWFHWDTGELVGKVKQDAILYHTRESDLDIRNYSVG